MWIESQLRANACSTVAVNLHPISQPWEGGTCLSLHRKSHGAHFKEIVFLTSFHASNLWIITEATPSKPIVLFTVQDQIPRITTAVTNIHAYIHTQESSNLAQGKGLLETGMEVLMQFSCSQSELEDFEVSLILKDQGREQRQQEAIRPC